MECYATSLQHILAELERIDLLIQLQVGRARQLHATDEHFQGLYIPEEEVDLLLSTPAGLPRWATEPVPLAQTDAQTLLDQMALEIAWRKVESHKQGVILRLDCLRQLFGLSPLEVDALLICLAPEIDLRYERFFGYLQDDITKRYPSVDLVLNLLSLSFVAKLANRQYFCASGQLIQHQLLQFADDSSDVKPALLSRYLKADERIVNYLFDGDELDAQLLPYVQYILPAKTLTDLLLPIGLQQQLATLTHQQSVNGAGLLFYFQGPYGVGKQSAAEALCRQLGQGLLRVDGKRLATAERMVFDAVVRLTLRESRLLGAALYWDGFDALLTDDKASWRSALFGALEAEQSFAFLAGDTTWEPMDALYQLPFVRVEFPRPRFAERAQLWALALSGAIPKGADGELAALADKFRFTGGQIRDAVATARNLARRRKLEADGLTLEDLYTACRLQSNRKLTELAHKITPHYTWNAIVLPADRMQQLREIVNQMKYRARVYEEWGFDRKLALGKGINVLFAGPSGTGKTMAADIIAGTLGLDLYKIDLSTIVSKYIGETEKNLALIFQEAENSNAILFFDEADALFGKRSEVRDSHDRYANIEISYLLQRMEEYDGVVILATNLHKNMDDAFVRRMHFTVEFPFPDAKQRRRIWENIWPEDTPRDPNLDLDFVARSFEVAGGNIRNIALSAAFLAAADGGQIQMDHVLHATQREYQKLGKVIAEGEFRRYAEQMKRSN